MELLRPEDAALITPVAARAVFFHLDIASWTFTSVRGEAQALLGENLAAWLRPGFLEDHVIASDLQGVCSFLEDCAAEPGVRAALARYVTASGEVVFLRHTVLHHDGTEVRGCLQRVGAREADIADLYQVEENARQVLLDTSVEIAQSVNQISDYAALLGKHLSRQGDDLGGDFAVGIRDGVERLRAMIDQISSEAREPRPVG